MPRFDPREVPRRKFQAATHHAVTLQATALDLLQQQSYQHAQDLHLKLALIDTELAILRDWQARPFWGRLRWLVLGR